MTGSSSSHSAATSRAEGLPALCGKAGGILTPRSIKPPTRTLHWLWFHITTSCISPFFTNLGPYVGSTKTVPKLKHPSKQFQKSIKISHLPHSGTRFTRFFQANILLQRWVSFVVTSERWDAELGPALQELSGRTGQVLREELWDGQAPAW